MSVKGEGRRGRRGRWLLLAVLLGAVAWIVRSRRAAAAADIGTGWPPPRPTGAGAEWLNPAADGAARAAAAPRHSAGVNGACAISASASNAAPAWTPPAPAPRAVASPVREAAPATRRPSPRPRVAAPAPPARNGLPRGAATALPDGSAPGPEYTVKGNAGSMLFHTPTSPYFGRTKAEYWFRTADDARAAGFTEWTPRKR
jgi:hypothetical protein